MNNFAVRAFVIIKLIAHKMSGLNPNNNSLPESQRPSKKRRFEEMGRRDPHLEREREALFG